MRISQFLLRERGEAEVIPWGYGIVYFDFRTRSIFLLPIPINVIVRFSICVYWRIVYIFYPSQFDKRLQEARQYGWDEAYKISHENGKKDGHAEGYKEGYEKGWYAFGDFMLAELKKPVSERYKD